MRAKFELAKLRIALRLLRQLSMFGTKIWACRRLFRKSLLQRLGRRPEVLHRRSSGSMDEDERGWQCLF